MILRWEPSRSSKPGRERIIGRPRFKNEPGAPPPSSPFAQGSERGSLLRTTRVDERKGRLAAAFVFVLQKLGLRLGGSGRLGGRLGGRGRRSSLNRILLIVEADDVLG